jgi:hypothetical protein
VGRVNGEDVLNTVHLITIAVIPSDPARRETRDLLVLPVYYTFVQTRKAPR